MQGAGSINRRAGERPSERQQRRRLTRLSSIRFEAIEKEFNNEGSEGAKCLLDRANLRRARNSLPVSAVCLAGRFRQLNDLFSCSHRSRTLFGRLARLRLRALRALRAGAKGSDR